MLTTQCHLFASKSPRCKVIRVQRRLYIDVQRVSIFSIFDGGFRIARLRYWLLSQPAAVCSRRSIDSDTHLPRFDVQPHVAVCLSSIFRVQYLFLETRFPPLLPPCVSPLICFCITSNTFALILVSTVLNVNPTDIYFPTVWSLSAIFDKTTILRYFFHVLVVF